MNNDEMDYLLDRLSDVLISCVILSTLFLLLWFVYYLLAGDWTYKVHSRFFELSRRDFDLVNYWGMAITKVLSIVFFLFPYLSIKILMRKKRRIK
ncbi:MAG: hypothetical protein FP814_10250 [Desulfobacterium sp.]|nr:hypothetical protein [Desulfobacterium sp.]MBU3947800.1 hypothetical protein [Pseudomonadota bacterium]MBU4011621.1 hypothetical protein [Pseudomonadota bacterium]MBU4036119.1 hypothetical protein [Pseudomonadota bacterium]